MTLKLGGAAGFRPPEPGEGEGKWGEGAAEGGESCPQPEMAATLSSSGESDPGHR